MKRRQFIGATVATGLSASIAPGAGTVRAADRAAFDSFELNELTVAALQEGMTAGRWTARRLVELYRGRIDAIDKRGPAINAVVELNPDALAIANGLDAERRAGKVRGPLHGIPVLIKDNIDTADRMQTTAGALALAGSIAPRDAFIVERLRAAGAVLLGKTNLSEWANFRSRPSSSGWSGRGGQTRNPYALNRSPCGSSSGSGSAGAANLAAVTIGTETDGSILCPSSVNGLVGIKPTVGLWSRSGIIPISHSQDTAGPMCRTVADAAVLLGALTGVDPRDSATEASRGRALSDYRQALDANALRGARIGVVRRHINVAAKGNAVFEEAVAALKRAGADLVDPTDFEAPAALGAAEGTVLHYEFKAGVEAYLATLGGRVPHRTLADIIAFNKANAAREGSTFGQESLERAAALGDLSSQEYLDALATSRRLSRDEGIDALLARHQVEALVAITTGPSWPIDHVSGDRFGGGSSTWAAVAGYPAITVPMGMIQGLPIGLSFMGPAWSEARLIGLAYAFEQATKARRAPTFQPVI